MRLVRELGVQIGERRCGTAAAEQAAQAVAGAFADLGLEPRFQEFEFVGYEPELVELEVDGEPWDVGLCMYSASTGPDGVEGAVRHVGTNVIAKDFFETPVFAIEDDSGRELARVFGNPFDGGAIPFMVSMGPILGGPQVFVSTADAARLRERDGARARLHVAGTLVPGRRERNVVAELRGRSDDAVVVGAHFDSVWR